MSKLSDRVDELEEELDYLRNAVQTFEAHCSSIPIEWVEVGGVRIGLDAGGTAVRVEFSKTLYGWENVS